MITYDYDKDVDVMYITFGTPEPCNNIETNEGLIVRFSIETGKLNGITIIDYSKKTKADI